MQRRIHYICVSDIYIIKPLIFSDCSTVVQLGVYSCIVLFRHVSFKNLLKRIKGKKIPFKYVKESISMYYMQII